MWLGLIGFDSLESAQERRVRVFGGTDAAVFKYYGAALCLQEIESCDKNHERSERVTDHDDVGVGCPDVAIPPPQTTGRR
jgi:hypothetical protein